MPREDLDVNIIENISDVTIFAGITGCFAGVERV